MRLSLSRGALALALVVGACGTKKPAGPAVTPPLRACLEAATDLPRPPSGRLPCELIPPYLELPAE